MVDDTYLDSAILGSLRRFLELCPALEQMIGPIAQYKIVLDANAAVSDLIHKYTYPNVRQTALEEAVCSSTVELHAPFWLDEEMIGSTIPKVSARRRIPESALQSLWEDYRKKIIWHETSWSFGDDNLKDLDPKDVPYVALQQTIAAAATLSQDRDIDDFGGKRVTLEFILSVRSYARAASYAVGIRVGGVCVATISVGLLADLGKLIGSSISRLPEVVKIAIVVAIAFLIVHPRSRERIFALLQTLGERVTILWPEIERLFEVATTKQSEAAIAFGKSERLLDQ